MRAVVRCNFVQEVCAYTTATTTAVQAGGGFRVAAAAAGAAAAAAAAAAAVNPGQHCACILRHNGILLGVSTHLLAAMQSSTAWQALDTCHFGFSSTAKRPVNVAESMLPMVQTLQTAKAERHDRPAQCGLYRCLSIAGQGLGASIKIWGMERARTESEAACMPCFPFASLKTLLPG